MIGTIPPGLILIAGALILMVLGRVARGPAFLVFPALAFVQILGLEPGTRLTIPFATYELVPLEVDRLSHVFGYVFTIIAFLGGIYSLHMKEAGQQVSALLYAGSALGVVYAGDLFTVFFFWEIMAFASAYLVWARRTPESYASAIRYLFVHLFGGSLLMGGIFWHLAETGSLAFVPFEEATVASVLVLLGFGVNAAFVPLHAWIADAYPRGTVTGSVFLSAFTTKTAVYTLAHAYPGWEILLWVGVVMTVWGVTYALLANDIRRILAYHIVSQVGFMVAGVGVGTAMALNGATSHAFTHILYKGLLFMATGAVLFSVGTGKLTELGGLLRRLPWTFGFYMVAALSISSAPLFSGFISKPMTIDAAAYAGHPALAVLLLHLASVGTFLSVGLKLPWYAWGTEPKREHQVRPIPMGMLVAMGLTAILNVVLGVWPDPLYAVLPFPVEYEPYSVTALSKALQLLLFTAVGFFLLTYILTPKAKLQLDVDWLYRRPRAFAWSVCVVSVNRAFGATERAAYRAVHALGRASARPVATTLALLGKREAARAASLGEGEAGPRDLVDFYRLPMGSMVAILLVVLLLSAVLIYL